MAKAYENYQPPYNNIDEPNVTNFLEQDIYYNTEEKANILRQVEDMKVRQQRYLENGDTSIANTVQNKIDSFNAYADRLQVQVDGSTADLAIAKQRQTPQQTDTAQNQIENNPPSDNNPDVETLPLAEEAQLEEVDLTPADPDDVGEILADFDGEPPMEDLPPLQQDQESSADNEELATSVGEQESTNQANEVNKVAKKVYVEYPNILHQFPSYTYGLSLHLLGADEWNSLTSTGNYQASNVLIASAGKFDDTIGPNSLIRNKYFSEDFYFEKLELTTVIGPTDNNPATNAINFDFTIIEPYGVSLLNRLIDASKDISDSEKSSSYLENVYLIPIDFYAQSAECTTHSPVRGISKYIPIKLNSMDFTVGLEGSQYTISATPYNHSAFDQATQTTPLHLEITAGTVADFFSFNGIETLDDQFAQSQREETEAKARYERGNTSKYSPGISGVNPALMSGIKKASQQVYKVKGYASAYNAYYEGLRKNNDIQYSDIIKFKFDDKIGSALIVQAGKTRPVDTPMNADAQNQNNQRRQYVFGSGKQQLVFDLDLSLRKYAINAGTSIEAILSDLITNSTYILDQIDDPSSYTDPKVWAAEKLSKKDQPFNWFKVVPEVKLDKFDTTTMRWSRTITYHVKTYEVRNNKLSSMPGGKADIPLKVYKYIFTGENNDILDFDIKFNALYYTAVTSYTNKLTKNSGVTDPNESAQKVIGSEKNSPWTVQPKRVVPQILDSQAQATGGGTTSQQMAAADASKSILTGAAGDMINVQLKIIGDPLFIKQDELFYQPSAQKTKFKNDTITPNGSFIMDTGEMYVQIEWKTPVDYDQSTGQVRYEERYQSSLFNGMYKIITVSSSFSSGQFIQTLELVRQWDQDRFDYTVSKKDDSDSQRQGKTTVDGNDTSSVLATTPEPNAVLTNAPVKTVTNDVSAIDSNPEQDDPQIVIDADADDLASRKEFQDLEARFENAANPFDGIPAGASAPSQQNSFGQ